MIISRWMNISALGLALLPVACLGSADDMDAPLLTAPSHETLGDPDGTTGNNGEITGDFHDTKYTLLSATYMPILSNDPNYKLSAEQIGLLNDPKGQHTFEYAMRCGLKRNTSVFDSNNIEYPGGGMLNTTAGWLNSPLDDNTRQDLFACMLAHLNPSGITVPLRLTGASVPNSGDDVSQFTFQEALWIMSGSPSSMQFHVWPLPDLYACYGPVTSSAIETRVCGQGATECGLTVRTDRNTACSKDPVEGTWTCDGQPAIQSWLRADDVPLLYGSKCAPREKL